jgi:CBS domain-containing protein
MHARRGASNRASSLKVDAASARYSSKETISEFAIERPGATTMRPICAGYRQSANGIPLAACQLALSPKPAVSNTSERIMLCSEVRDRGIQFIRDKERVRAAAEKMRDDEIGFLPVCSSKTRKLVGTLTDCDLAIRLAAEGMGTDVPVDEIMSTGLVFCYVNDDLEEARELMESNQVSRMIVLDENDRLAGVISLADITAEKASMGNTPHQIKQL